MHGPAQADDVRDPGELRVRSSPLRLHRDLIDMVDVLAEAEEDMVAGAQAKLLPHLEGNRYLAFAGDLRGNRSHLLTVASVSKASPRETVEPQRRAAQSLSFLLGWGCKVRRLRS